MGHVFSNMCYQCWSHRLLRVVSQGQYPDPYLQSPCWSQPRGSDGMSALPSRTQLSGSTRCTKAASRGVENRRGNLTVCLRWQISGHQHGCIPWHGCVSAPAETPCCFAPSRHSLKGLLPTCEEQLISTLPQVQANSVTHLFSSSVQQMKVSQRLFWTRSVRNKESPLELLL